MSDATYKILTEGFPILTVGTTDKSKVFHPFGFAIVNTETEHDFSFLFNSIKESIKKSSQLTYKPTKLIADNAAAIHNGFIACFGDLNRRINCWAHCIRLMDAELEPLV